MVLFRIHLIQIVHYIEIKIYIFNFYITIVKIIFRTINYRNSDQNVQNCMKIACNIPLIYFDKTFSIKIIIITYISLFN